MSLFGQLIKKGIELNSALRYDTDSPRVHQERQLRSLLDTAKDTALGRYHGFSVLLESEDVIKAFQQEVPIRDYDQMKEAWWQKQMLYPDITWSGSPDFYALSSGTTGKSSKRIPITADFLQSMRNVGQSLLQDLPAFDLPEAVFESEILMLGSSANLSKHDQGHLEGEISGINTSNFPDWYDLFYRPGSEIAAIKNWDERVQRIAEESKDWKIGSIAGIPSWVLLMLKKVIEYNKAETIHDVWPDLEVYSSGGVAFETYRKDFEAITARPLTIIDTYLASEGFFAYTARPGTMAMKLALEHGYFYEFIPFDERGVDTQGGLLDDPMVLSISEVEVNQDYVLLVSTCSGAWRYQIGDVIKFTQLDSPEIIITGRTKFFLNVVGSQLSEEKMDDAILKVSESLGISVNEYAVAAIRNEEDDYIHQWVIVSDKDVDEAVFTKELDSSLKEANKNYGVARSKALKDISVMAISKEVYHAFLEAGKKKGGQVKTPKVMSEEKMKEFLSHIDSHT